MTKATSYADQLKHPNWQRKRLEVLQRAGFKCERCHDTESTLHVHHKRYVKGRKAWEYSAEELTALCENCHEGAHDQKADFETLMVGFDADGPNDVGAAMALVAGWAHFLRHTGEEGDALASANPHAATCGLIARMLFEIFDKDDGLKMLIIFASSLGAEGFIGSFAELLIERAKEAQQGLEEPEKP